MRSGQIWETLSYTFDIRHLVHSINLCLAIDVIRYGGTAAGPRPNTGRANIIYVNVCLDLDLADYTSFTQVRIH